MKKSGCFIIGLAVFLCASMGLNMILFFAAAGSWAKPGVTAIRSAGFPVQETVVAPATDGSSHKIALIHLRGIISSSVSGPSGESMVGDIKQFLRHATGDDDVKAIVVHIDSPGGEVTASDELYHAIRGAREQKPLVVFMGSIAASGGYYAACGGSYLMASETTITGSIGVIIQTLNYRELLGKIGLDAVVFKSGEFKDTLSGTREMSAEEKAYIQGLVMQTYGKFIGVVATERAIEPGALRAGPGDGRIFSGLDAKEAGLIDGLGYVEDAFAKARQLGDAPGAVVVRYAAPFRLGNLFRLFGESRAHNVEVTLGGTSLPRLESGRLYLLPPFYFP